MKKKRVLVVGLGNMGMSHALAYTRIPGFEVVGVCTRGIAAKALPEALANAKRYSNYRAGDRRAEAGRRVDQYPPRHPRRLRDQSDGSGRPRVRREAARRDSGKRRAGRGDRQAHEQKTRDRLHPPAPSVVDKVHRGRENTRNAARLPHEPEPAVERRDMGMAQAADEFLLAHRRLRRPLCRCDVPDDGGQADPRPRARGTSHRRSADVQLRRAAGGVRRWFGRLV